MIAVRPRTLAPLLWTLAAATGLGCKADVVSVTAELSLRHPIGCELGEVSDVTLRATGDFPPWEQLLDLSGGGDPLSGAPADSRLLVFDGDYAAGPAGGQWTLDDDDQHGEVLMLPLGRSCQLSEDSPIIEPGAAVVPLGDGSLLSFGGHGPDGATDRVLIRRPGQLDLEPLDARMSVPRAWATATRVGNRVVVAGGGPGGDVRLIYESFEVFDLDTERFLPDLRGKLAHGPRRSHSAVALADGQVLIVGGVGEGSEAPLATAELIDASTGEASPLPDDLQEGRSTPGLWRMRSGVIMVVGGEDARGIAVPSAEWLDLERMRFMPTGAQLRAYPDAEAVLLSGNRIAWFGCDAQAGSCGLDLLLANFDVEPVPLERTGLGGAKLGQLRVQSLGLGVLQIHGEDDNDGTFAVQYDLNTGTTRPAIIDSALRELWPLDDNSMLHHGVDGTFVTRHALRSPYDAPGDALLSPDALGVTLDARGRWAVSDLGLSARAPQARFDLPYLVFGTLHVALEVDGSAELLLTPDGVRAIAVSIERTRIAVGDCNLSRAIDEPVHVRRSGQQLTIESAGQSDGCTIDSLQGPVGIGMRAAPGSTVTSFEVAR